MSRLVELRNEMELSQRDVADRLSQSRSYVSKVEIFERRLDFVQLVDWLRALGADEQKFISTMLKEIPAVRRKR